MKNTRLKKLIAKHYVECNKKGTEVPQDVKQTLVNLLK